MRNLDQQSRLDKLLRVVQARLVLLRQTREEVLLAHHLEDREVLDVVDGLQQLRELETNLPQPEATRALRAWL